jgi:hypothetical protein
VATYRAKIDFHVDTGLPRDVISVNPCYISQGDPQALADQLKTNIIAHVLNGALNWFVIRLYNVRQAPPSYPVAEASNVVAAKASVTPRELALCLSFYSEHNRPSQRGRIYWPMALINGTPAQRPTQAQMQQVADIGKDVLNVAPGLGQWAIWSPTRQEEHVVTDYWVDDEWDIVRSRGLKGTTRITSP